jgi:glutamate synthase (NADPH/NADH) small chain
MGDPKGFLKLHRATPNRQASDRRTQHFREFYDPMADAEISAQGARCMECGVAFCHGDHGCPVRNLIPEWNDLVYRGRWREANDVLHSTNNFPEFTGRLCPAPCESACVLALIDDAVAIRTIEQAIVDRAWNEGWILPKPPIHETGKRVAVIGSGPAGLAAAQQLRRLGHSVVVFERNDRLGGLLRYGIPDFKLEKPTLDRRIRQLAAEGVEFRARVCVGEDVRSPELRRHFDAILLSGGASQARDLVVPGRALRGIHFAIDFLTAQNRRIAGDANVPELSARNKRVVIIGGGDTGSDCAGVCLRQGARSVVQFELLPKPPAQRADSTPWPLWPMQLRSSHAHEEGCDREWSVATLAFVGEKGTVSALSAVRVEPRLRDNGRVDYAPIPGSEFDIGADLVLLALGFTNTATPRWHRDLGVERDDRGTIITDGAHRTTSPGVYVAGDERRGASLIVWAIREGRDAAASIHADCTS